MDHQLRRDNFEAAVGTQRDAKWKRRRHLGSRRRTGGGLKRKYLLSRREWNVRHDAGCQRVPGEWRLWKRDHEAFHHEWSTGRVRLLQHVQPALRTRTLDSVRSVRAITGTEFQRLSRSNA